jgi:hypothetical protein
MEDPTMRDQRIGAFLLGGVLAAAATIWLRQPEPVANAQEGRQPFASSVEQRQQTVEELRKLNALMQKQIDLLQSGKVRVVVVEDKAEGGRRKAE